jgi:hypothetical protein
MTPWSQIKPIHLRRPLTCAHGARQSITTVALHVHSKRNSGALVACGVLCGARDHCGAMWKLSGVGFDLDLCATRRQQRSASDGRACCHAVSGLELREGTGERGLGLVCGNDAIHWACANQLECGRDGIWVSEGKGRGRVSK